MHPIAVQYSELKYELDTNQQEYQAKQAILLSKMNKLQENCPHDETDFVLMATSSGVKCRHCCKLME